MRRRYCLPFLVLPVIPLGAYLSGTVAQAAEDSREARVKAAYLYNLSLLVDWSGLPDAAFTLCVSGDREIGTALQSLEARPVKERPLRIALEPVDPGACQMLFIGSEHASWNELLQQTQSGVLTVSDHAGFAREGGVVGFYTDAGKVKLEVSQGAAQRAGLRISSRVLEIARVLP